MLVLLSMRCTFRNNNNKTYSIGFRLVSTLCKESQGTQRDKPLVLKEKNDDDKVIMITNPGRGGLSSIGKVLLSAGYEYCTELGVAGTSSF